MHINKTNGGNFSAVNYATLEAEVEQYIADFLESTREDFGETEEEADARIAAEKEKFRRAPWEALRWYVEHRLPSEQYDLINVGVPVPEGLEPADDEADQLNPQYRVVEVDGKPTLAGNADASLEIAMRMGTPEALEFLAAYREELVGLRAINKTASPEALREQAYTMTLARCGVLMEPSGALQ